MHSSLMQKTKEAPQIGHYVLAKLGAALRNLADKHSEAELPPRMRSLLIELQREDPNASTQDQSAAEPAGRSRVR
jgi:hydrogenase maturation factor